MVATKRTSSTGRSYSSHHQPLELVELGGCRLVAAESERPFERVDGGIERTIDVVRRALQSQRAVDLVRQALAQRIHDARLADPRLSRQQHHLAVALLRQVPAFGEKSDLLLAPHEGRQPRPGSGLEAAGGVAHPDDAPGAGGLGNALEGMLTQVRVLEAASRELARAIADDDGVGLGQRLQSRRQVGRVAESESLVSCPPTDVADHHHPCVDADTHR